MTLEEIAEKEGLVYLLNQLFIDMVKEDSKVKRFGIHKDNWELIIETHHELLSTKLKEQREECVKAWRDIDRNSKYQTITEIESAIRNTPEPKF